MDYKYEGTPCASVDKDQVFIPLSMLQEGRVDETISAVIHELHHIKYSYKESDICERIMPYFERILKITEDSGFNVKNLNLPANLAPSSRVLDHYEEVIKVILKILSPEKIEQEIPFSALRTGG